VTNIKDEAVRAANAQLTAAGLSSYSELLEMLIEAKKMGLSFDIGNAYIRRSYIDHQEQLVKRINAATKAYAS
jgi:hypothetical protein